MATWAGAIVRVEDPARFVEVATKHRVAVSAASPSWVLIAGDPRLRRMGPPAFAEALSRELQTSVVAFFIQTAASNERVEHWDQGRLVRELEFAGDSGGWIAQSGTPQQWESSLFFSEDESTAEGAPWPLNLREDISEDDIRRYARARAVGDATQVMDLLVGGSASSVERMCRFFGVDPQSPGARYRSPTNWRLRLLASAVILLLVGAFVLGALTGR
jgi:hypothetical protein